MGMRLWLAVLCLFAGAAQSAVLLRDNFEYSVTREQTGKTAAFASGGGWTSTKSNPEQTGACGYFYTTTSIPGFAGSFPGTSSSRVLAVEMLPVSLDCLVGEGWWQTDTYMAIGGEVAAQNTIPPNSWIQYWLYIQDYGTQQTEILESHKWLYPCIDGQPTCDGANTPYLYLLSNLSVNPYSQTATAPNAYVRIAVANGYYSPGDPEPGPNKLGHNISSSTGLLTVNTWILVKINISIGGSIGVYREWHKTVSGSFVEVANWTGSVTANFTWDLDGAGLNSARSTGMKSLKAFSTWNNTDAYFYIDDFVLADSEASLPTYGTLLSAPGRPRWRPLWDWWPQELPLY